MLFSKQEKPAEQSSSVLGSCCRLLITSCRSAQRLQSYIYSLGRSSFFNRSHTEKSFCTFSWRKTSVERAHTHILSQGATQRKSQSGRLRDSSGFCCLLPARYVTENRLLMEAQLLMLTTPESHEIRLYDNAFGR